MQHHPTKPTIIKEAAHDAGTAEAMAAKRSLIGLDKEQLNALFASMGLPPFRAQQVWGWIYRHGVTDFADMHNISKEVRAQLDTHFSVARAGVSRSHISIDETQKWLLTFADGREVETVYIPETDRGTLCISSQVGCTLACTFCHTGTQQLVRNLTASEIVTQLLTARDGLGEWAHSDDRRKVSNIVFMGMGEPLFNFEHVVHACNLLTDPDGIAISKRKVIVSTSGVVPKMRELAERTGVSLAVSLHATNDRLRDEIVPINRKYPIAELLQACHAYMDVLPNRHIMFEYVMLSGVNDSDADARALVALLKGLPSKVNLIPFNPWPGAPYTCSSNNRMHAFQRILHEAGISTPIRKTRGQDILAACGQLKSASERERREKVSLH
jgi:23S rRNA (adenine2503-C2)-methyltransferase